MLALASMTLATLPRTWDILQWLITMDPMCTKAPEQFHLHGLAITLLTTLAGVTRLTVEFTPMVSPTGTATASQTSLKEEFGNKRYFK